MKNIKNYLIFAMLSVLLLIQPKEINRAEPIMLPMEIETVREIYIYVPVTANATLYTDNAAPQTTTYSAYPQEINEDFDIFTPCGYSYEQLLYSVSDEYRYEMAENISTILEAEERYGVNALYLMCKLGLESGWAKYPSGENNLGGWTNSDGSYMDFDSEEECILHIAEKLSTEYKDISGFRLEDVCERYCPSDGYSETLIDIMVGRKEKIEEMEVQSDELRI